MWSVIIRRMPCRLLDDSSRANVDDAATGPKLSNLGMLAEFIAIF